MIALAGLFTTNTLDARPLTQNPDTSTQSLRSLRCCSCCLLPSCTLNPENPGSGAEEPALLQLLRYLLLTFRALRRTDSGRAGARLPPPLRGLEERLMLPEPDAAPLPPEGSMPFEEADVQSLAQARPQSPTMSRDLR